MQVVILVPLLVEALPLVLLRLDEEGALVGVDVSLDTVADVHRHCITIKEHHSGPFFRST